MLVHFDCPACDEYVELHHEDAHGSHKCQRCGSLLELEWDVDGIVVHVVVTSDVAQWRGHRLADLVAGTRTAEDLEARLSGMLTVVAAGTQMAIEDFRTGGYSK